MSPAGSMVLQVYIFVPVSLNLTKKVTLTSNTGQQVLVNFPCKFYGSARYVNGSYRHEFVKESLSVILTLTLTPSMTF